MWIISKFSGMLNTRHLARCYENHSGTYAWFPGGAAYLISDKPVTTTIIEALRNNQDFLEVV